MQTTTSQRKSVSLASLALIVLSTSVKSTCVLTERSARLEEWSASATSQQLIVTLQASSCMPKLTVLHAMAAQVHIVSFHELQASNFEAHFYHMAWLP